MDPSRSISVLVGKVCLVHGTQETRLPSLGWEGSLEEKGNPLQHSWMEDPMDRGVWWAAAHGVTSVMTEQLKVNCSDMNLISSVYLYSSSLPVSIISVPSIT